MLFRSTFSAVASAETWERHFGRIIDTKAKGVTLVRDNDRTHYYDVSETVPISLGAPEVTLWHYDDTAHRPFFDAVVPGNADTEAKVSAIVEEQVKGLSARPADRRLITLSTTAVVAEIQANGSLIKHLQEVEDYYGERLWDLVERQMEREGVDDELKARDPLDWGGRVNNIRAGVKEQLIAEICR